MATNESAAQQWYQRYIAKFGCPPKVAKQLVTFVRHNNATISEEEASNCILSNQNHTNECNEAAREAYSLYIKDKGHAPTTARRLMEFAKKKRIRGVMFKDARDVLQNPPEKEELITIRLRYDGTSIDLETSNRKCVADHLIAINDFTKHPTKSLKLSANKMVLWPFRSFNKSFAELGIGNRDVIYLEFINTQNTKTNKARAQLIKVCIVEEVIQELQQKLSIQSEEDVIVPQVVKSQSFHDEKTGMNVLPLSGTVVSFQLDVPYDEWDEKMQNEFIYDVAKTYGVKPSELIPIAVAEGSLVMTFVLNVIQKQLPKIKKICAVIQTKASPYLEKWRVKASDMKNIFAKQQIKQKDDDLIDNEHEKDMLSSAQQWLLQQAESLRNAIMTALQNCSNEYEISAICLLDNEQSVNEFIKHPQYQKSKLLFHGTKLEHLESIYKNGFDDKFIGSANDPGWYGKGHYFTSYPQYAMPYCEHNAFGQGTLIVSYVNCGTSYQVYDSQTYYGKTLKNGYDSHYVKVDSSGESIPKSELKNYEDDIFDEYVIPTGQRVLPRFCVTFTEKGRVVVWRDKKLENVENSGILDKLRKSNVVYGAKTTKEALQIIKKKRDRNKVFLITNGADNSEELVKSVRHKLNIQEPILIFTGSMDYDEFWRNNYRNVKVTTSSDDVFEFVTNNLSNEDVEDEGDATHMIFYKKQFGSNLEFINGNTIKKTAGDKQWSTCLLNTTPITNAQCDQFIVEYNWISGMWIHPGYITSSIDESISDWSVHLGSRGPSGHSKHSVGFLINVCCHDYCTYSKDHPPTGGASKYKSSDKFKNGDRIRFVFDFTSSQFTMYHNDIEAGTLPLDTKSIIPGLALYWESEVEITKWKFVKNNEETDEKMDQNTIIKFVQKQYILKSKNGNNNTIICLDGDFNEITLKLDGLDSSFVQKMDHLIQNALNNKKDVTIFVTETHSQINENKPDLKIVDVQIIS
eukprot:713721_1